MKSSSGGRRTEFLKMMKQKLQIDVLNGHNPNSFKYKIMKRQDFGGRSEAF